MDYTDALKELKALTSTGDALKADLVDLAKRVSIQAQGVDANATTVLYSGMIGSTHSSEIIYSMGADASIRTVDKTNARLLRHAPVHQHASGRKDHGLCE